MTTNESAAVQATGADRDAIVERAAQEGWSAARLRSEFYGFNTTVHLTLSAITDRKDRTPIVTRETFELSPAAYHRLAMNRLGSKEEGSVDDLVTALGNNVYAAIGRAMQAVDRDMSYEDLVEAGVIKPEDQQQQGDGEVLTGEVMEKGETAQQNV